MSLDVYLIGEQHEVNCYCSECGHKHTKIEEERLYEANVTHNLNKMADKAGIYQALWRPDENGMVKAKDIIDILTKGLKKMKKYPERFKKLNPPNGWGSYDEFVPWIENYLKVCIEYPEATIKVSR